MAYITVSCDNFLGSFLFVGLLDHSGFMNHAINININVSSRGTLFGDDLTPMIIVK